MWPGARIEIPSIRALLLINTPSVILTASYSILKTRGEVRRVREREDGNCVTSFRLDAVAAPRDAPFPAQNSVRPMHPTNLYPHATHTSTYCTLLPCGEAATGCSLSQFAVPGNTMASCGRCSSLIYTSAPRKGEKTPLSTAIKEYTRQ